MSAKRRTPARPRVTREMIDPRTGDVHTLVYERTPTRHVVRHEVPFGSPERGAWSTAPWKTRRNAWRRLQTFHGAPVRSRCRRTAIGDDRRDRPGEPV